MPIPAPSHKCKRTGGLPTARERRPAIRLTYLPHIQGWKFGRIDGAQSSGEVRAAPTGIDRLTPGHGAPQTRGWTRTHDRAPRGQPDGRDATATLENEPPRRSIAPTHRDKSGCQQGEGDPVHALGDDVILPVDRSARGDRARDVLRHEDRGNDRPSAHSQQGGRGSRASLGRGGAQAPTLSPPSCDKQTFLDRTGRSRFQARSFRETVETPNHRLALGP